MQYKNFKKNNSGFAILFAVTLSSILLAIALGVAEIALKEVKFGTSARSTNEAFFAADTGIECTLINDKSENSSFVPSGRGVNCLGTQITYQYFPPDWNFVLSGLGSAGQGCAKVTVSKITNGDGILVTTISSKGYDTGGSSGSCDPTSNSVEREIETIY